MIYKKNKKEQISENDFNKNSMKNQKRNKNSFLKKKLFKKIKKLKNKTF